tara:strand:+ start:21563 stop:23356 length:1794 start_codon:yes stop_codon:yes gene_type:complete
MMSAGIIFVFQNCAQPLEEVTDVSSSSSDSSSSSSEEDVVVAPPNVDVVEDDGDPQADFQVISVSQNVSSTENQSVTLSITTSGGEVGGYRWNYRGFSANNFTAISNSNSNSLTLNPLAMSDEGVYRVEVLDLSGSVITAHEMSVTVAQQVTPVTITGLSPAASAAAHVIQQNTSMTLQVTATGTISGYQWYKNNAAIPEAIGPSYNLTATTIAGAEGTYKVRVLGPDGYVDSGNIVIEVRSNVTLSTISASPDASSFDEGTSFTLSVVSTGNVSSYRWYKDNSLLATYDTTSNSSAYMVSNAATSAAGTYMVRVYNNLGEQAGEASRSISIVQAGSPTITRSVSTYDFGERSINTNHDYLFTITNSGTAAATGMSISNPSSPFSRVTNMDADACTAGMSLAANTSCTIRIRFNSSNYSSNYSSSSTIGWSNLSSSNISFSASTPAPPVVCASADRVATFDEEASTGSWNDLLSGTYYSAGDTGITSWYGNFNTLSPTAVITSTGSDYSGYTYQWQRRQLTYESNGSGYEAKFVSNSSWQNVSGQTSETFSSQISNLLWGYAYRIRASKTDCTTRYSNPVGAYWFYIDNRGRGGQIP